MEPHIDARTVELQHTRYHAAYITRLNSLLEGHQDLLARPLEDIIAHIRSLPEEIRQAVRNQGGGHLNHSLLWQTIGPPAEPLPEGILADAIDAAFGSFSDFKAELSMTALNRFGSGWAWLCLNSHANLEVMSTPNEDSPIMLGATPILGVDLWEHAYYLKYLSRRADYILAWWNVINWDAVTRLYTQYLASTPKR